jgi:hypothetical protein
MRKTFVVGKCNRKTRQLVFLELFRGPIVGPFSLHAVVARA